MAVVKYIRPASAFKIGLAVNAILGFLAGTLCTITILTAIAPNLHASFPFVHGFGVLLPILLCPMLYGVIGGIATVIGAVLYNLASAWFGGLEVEVG